MKSSLKKGFSFGLTSGVITTLGLMVGLYSTTKSLLAVIGGILVIAIADALSDALGVHISEEFSNHTSTKEIWRATISTFAAKFCFAMIFIIPFLFLNLKTAIIVNVILGLLIITIFSYYMGLKEKVSTYKVVLEHLLITVLVVIVTYLVGELVNIYFI